MQALQAATAHLGSQLLNLQPWHHAPRLDAAGCASLRSSARSLAGTDLRPTLARWTLPLLVGALLSHQTAQSVFWVWAGGLPEHVLRARWIPPACARNTDELLWAWLARLLQIPNFTDAAKRQLPLALREGGLALGTSSVRTAITHLAGGARSTTLGLLRRWLTPTFSVNALDCLLTRVRKGYDEAGQVAVNGGAPEEIRSWLSRDLVPGKIFFRHQQSL